jgi:uncharacterized protein (TIGR03437 family)
VAPRDCRPRVELSMTRRLALALLGLGGKRLQSEVPAREFFLTSQRESVPVTGADGRIAYRFPAFNSMVRIDLGEGQTIELCCIPGGVGMMGSERRHSTDTIRSTPVHPVRLNGFLLGRFSVTTGQWLRVSRLSRVNRDLIVPFRRPRTPEEELWPAEAISSLQAEEFCNRLARFTGLPFRLPSETEWEYACRAGTSTVYHFGDNYGSSVSNSEVISTRLEPVGIKNAPNRYGLHDMYGFGAWCSDWSHPDYVGKPADGSPWRSPRGNPNMGIVRGYNFFTGSAGRTDFPRGGFTSFFGLRVALSYTHGVTDPLPMNVFHGFTNCKDLVSPGQLLSIRGDAIGPGDGLSAEVTADKAVADSLAGVKVFIGESPAPILFASKERVDLIVPMGVRAGETATIVLRHGGQSSAPLLVKILDSAPGLLVRDQAKSGAVWAMNENGSLNDAGTPCLRGSIVTLYGSGFGELEPKKPDGTIVNEPLGNLPKPIQPVRVWIGSVECALEYCGQASGMVLGVVQLNVRIPIDLPGGALAIVVAVGERRSAADMTVWVG